MLRPPEELVPSPKVPTRNDGRSGWVGEGKREEAEGVDELLVKESA
jgi:hypothetical protein